MNSSVPSLNSILHCFPDDIFKLFTSANPKRTIVTIHLSRNKDDLNVFKVILTSIWIGDGGSGLHFNSTKINSFFTKLT